MVYLKPLFALFTLAISVAPLLMVSAAKFEVSISTDNDDDKQFQRVYACSRFFFLPLVLCYFCPV